MPYVFMISTLILSDSVSPFSHPCLLKSRKRTAQCTVLYVLYPWGIQTIMLFTSFLLLCSTDNNIIDAGCQLCCGHDAEAICFCTTSVSGHDLSLRNTPGTQADMSLFSALIALLLIEYSGSVLQLMTFSIKVHNMNVGYSLHTLFLPRG